MSRHSVAIKFEGDVLDMRIMLEGQKVRLRFDGERVWTRVLSGFQIQGKLEYVCEAVGLSGTECELVFMIDGKAREPIRGTLEDRYLKFEGSLQ